MEAILRAVSEEIDGMRVRTADHIAEDGRDTGRVLDVIDPRTGTVRVGWDTGVRTDCDVLDLVAE